MLGVLPSGPCSTAPLQMPGKALVPSLLSAHLGDPVKVIVFLRDETKRHDMRLDHEHKRAFVALPSFGKS